MFRAFLFALSSCFHPCAMLARSRQEKAAVMSSRFQPLAPQPPAQVKARALPVVSLPWAEFGLACLLGLLLLV